MHVEFSLPWDVHLVRDQLVLQASNEPQRAQRHPAPNDEGRARERNAGVQANRRPHQHHPQVREGGRKPATAAAVPGTELEAARALPERAQEVRHGGREQPCCTARHARPNSPAAQDRNPSYRGAHRRGSARRVQAQGLRGGGHASRDLIPAVRRRARMGATRGSTGRCEARVGSRGMVRGRAITLPSSSGEDTLERPANRDEALPGVRSASW